jgi:uncharacterized membrane protein
MCGTLSRLASFNWNATIPLDGCGANLATKDDDMKTTVTGMFTDRNEAADAVREIKAMGLIADDISIITNKGETEGQRSSSRTTDGMSDGAGGGALIGGALGGGAGLLAGLGAIAIPGLGPVLGAGWLITTAVGAAVGATGGGLIGALVDAGVDNEDAQTYVEGIRTGGTLVSVRTADADVEAVKDIMTRYNGMARGRMAPTGGMRANEQRDRTTLRTSSNNT